MGTLGTLLAVVVHKLLVLVDSCFVEGCICCYAVVDYVTCVASGVHMCNLVSFLLKVIVQYQSH